MIDVSVTTVPDSSESLPRDETGGFRIDYEVLS